VKARAILARWQRVQPVLGNKAVMTWLAWLHVAERREVCVADLEETLKVCFSRGAQILEKMRKNGLVEPSRRVPTKGNRPRTYLKATPKLYAVLALEEEA
jgi:hypothetical protein